MSVGPLKCLVVLGLGLGQCHTPLKLEAVRADAWSLYLDYDVLMAKESITFTIHTLCVLIKVLNFTFKLNLVEDKMSRDLH